MGERNVKNRDRLLILFACVFALLALSNALKPLQLEGAKTGFVLFGTRLEGTWNVLGSFVMAGYLAIYAFGIWKMKRFVVGMAHLYAFYVMVNIIMFPYRTGLGVETLDARIVIFYAIYSVLGIGFSVFAAVVLTRRKHLFS